MGIPIQMSIDFSSEIMDARRKWYFLSVLKEKDKYKISFSPEFLKSYFMVEEKLYYLRWCSMNEGLLKMIIFKIMKNKGI